MRFTTFATFIRRRGGDEFEMVFENMSPLKTSRTEARSNELTDEEATFHIVPKMTKDRILKAMMVKEVSRCCK